MPQKCVLSCSVVSDSVTPWTLPAPLSMEFPRQECWSELPFPPPGDPSDPGIKPAFLIVTPPRSTFSCIVKRVLYH